MKGNRQIGLDGRVFISDCLSDGIFFIYSIILSGLLGAVGDIMKLLGKSGYYMNPLTTGLIIMDLACCLGLVLVSYYVYFMNCGENMPRLGVKPLIYLEYARLAYYGMLIYDVLYRFSDATVHGGRYPVAMSVFYVVYLTWLVACSFAAMFILTILNQNMIRRSYSDSFKMLALVGLGINIVMPLVFFVTKIWIKGSGDGFYSAGLCDFIRLGIAPIFYAALWFIFLNAIDQVDRVFSEVDNAIRDKNYRIEFEEELSKKDAKKAEKAEKEEKNGKKAKPKKKKKNAAKTSDGAAEEAPSQDDSAVSPEIAFETAFDSSAASDSPEAVEDSGDSVGSGGADNTTDAGAEDEFGGMVDLNALLGSPEPSAEPSAEPAPDAASGSSEKQD